MTASNLPLSGLEYSDPEQHATNFETPFIHTSLERTISPFKASSDIPDCDEQRTEP